MRLGSNMKLLALFITYCLLSKSGKNNWGQWKDLGESGGQSFKGSDCSKSVNFSALVISSIKLSLFFGEVDQQTK